MNIRLGINGACGKMGTIIGCLAAADPRWKIVAAIESPSSPSIGKEYGTIAGIGEIGVYVSDTIAANIDVMIDFSTPLSTMHCTAKCTKLRIPVVIGTTGLSDGQRRTIKKYSKTIPVLLSSNMSVAVNLLFDIAPRILAALGKEYDVEIVETHHRLKKDAPSGTAVTIAEKFAAAAKKGTAPSFVYGRKGDVGTRKRGEIGIHAVRCGGVVGEHRVIYSSQGDTFEIVHRAHTREIFAMGALRMALAITGLPPGLYSVGDIVNTNAGK